MEEVKVAPDPTQEKTVLDPDHPLLKKFQESLKEHYLFQINRLKNEIFEYETETKKKNEERELLGVQTYETQQMVCRQQKCLEDLVRDVQSMTSAREEVENKIKEEKAKYKEAQEKMIAAEKSSLELQNEISAVNLLINQVSQWEKKIESNIAVNQRVAEKTRKDHLKLSEEKRKQDAQIYKITRAIWHLETEIDTMDMQIKLKETEREELEQTVALGNTNLEALQAEYRCLMHSWNSVVVAIGSRDRIVECLRTEENAIQEKVKSTISEAEKVRKLTKGEMNENQRFVLNKARAELDISNCKQQLEEETARFNEHARNMAEMQAIIDQTEKDIQRASEELKYKEVLFKRIVKDFDRISSKKYELERKLLQDIENQAANDTVAGNLMRLLNIAREKRKDLEIIMNEAENKHSLLVSDIESQKYKNEESERSLAEIEKEKTELDNEADGIQAEKDKYQMLFRKKERHVTVLNIKLEKILEKMQVKDIISPQELRIIALEKQIEETQDKIKNLQIFWLREQKNLLSVSKERQEQIHKLNLLRKQNLILEQKNLKVNNEIENYKKQEERVSQNINNLQNKTSVLCDNLYKKKDRKNVLDKKNYYLQSQYDGKLKDTELECLKIESDIAELEDEKVTLSKELIELNREALEWEKKVKLANQTKQDMRGVRGGTGDISNMRQEIQRMSVIYSQLKKAQEKLVKDLEHCVSRREAIFMVAEARQSRSKTSEMKTRINYTRKMDDIRNKIKQLENEKKTIEEKIEQLQGEKAHIEQEIESTKHDIEFCKNYSMSLKEQIEKRKTNRQLKFEMLIMTQRKLSMFNDLLAKRQPFIYTKKDNMQAEFYYQKDINGKLVVLIENLRSDFPNYKHQFNRLYNTLKLSVYTQYSSNLDIRID
ncbi:coiled-coil domain-containing protein 40 [Anthonomus grandis grandis]|uniref:coiled-coil domain-containing protein 40 n=1 Tax=Anthonomus grandis grandis TaxID=2921223 RepID=UPI0021652D17|nr:coiled-coil domain-containing protein 40 [Anthonomus grandis grandis]